MNSALPSATLQFLRSLQDAWSRVSSDHDARQPLHSAVLVAATDMANRHADYWIGKPLQFEDGEARALFDMSPLLWTAIGMMAQAPSGPPRDVATYQRRLEELTTELLAGDLGKLIEPA